MCQTVFVLVCVWVCEWRKGVLCPESSAGKSAFICSLGKHLLKTPSEALPGGGGGGVSKNKLDVSSTPEELTLWQGSQKRRNDTCSDNYCS